MDLEEDAIETCRYTLETLRHLRDHKPAEWDALVTPGLCSVWDELKRVLRRVGTEIPGTDEPSLEAGDWHDGPHEYEDGYDDDGQGIVCVKCAQAKREAKNVC